MKNVGGVRFAFMHLWFCIWSWNELVLNVMLGSPLWITFENLLYFRLSTRWCKGHTPRPIRAVEAQATLGWKQQDNTMHLQIRRFLITDTTTRCLLHVSCCHFDTNNFFKWFWIWTGSIIAFTKRVGNYWDLFSSLVNACLKPKSKSRN